MRWSKGQQDILSTIIISGILIGVVGSVYLWGVPLIQKNQDISTLRTAEDLMREINDKIKFVANNGGKDRVRIAVPGILSTDNGQLTLAVDTQGTIYAAEADVPLGENECATTNGVWGQDDSSVFCVTSHKVGDAKYRTTYTLRYIPLTVSALRTFKIDVGGTAIGGQDRTLAIEHAGTTEGPVTTALIRLDIV